MRVNNTTTIKPVKKSNNKLIERRKKKAATNLHAGSFYFRKHEFEENNALKLFKVYFILLINPFFFSTFFFK